MTIDREMTITRLSVFIFIARHPECLVRDIVKATGLNQSTIARIVALLSDKPSRGNREGLFWVDATPDHDDPRRMRLSLTAKGRKVASDLSDLFTDLQNTPSQQRETQDGI